MTARCSALKKWQNFGADCGQHKVFKAALMRRRHGLLIKLSKWP